MSSLVGYRFLDTDNHTDSSTNLMNHLSNPNDSQRNIRNSHSPISHRRYLDPSDDILDSGADSNKSSDEMEVHATSSKHRTIHRKNSIMNFSTNVKRKISSTFHRRNSITNSPQQSRRHERCESPHLRDEKNTSPLNNRRKKSLGAFILQKSPTLDTTVAENKQRRRSSVSALREPNRFQSLASMSDSNVVKNQISINISDMSTNELYKSEPKPEIDENKNRSPSKRKSNAADRLKITTSSSIPDIQSRSRQNSMRAMKQFNIYILGSKAVGKTALTVRFLTGRYIHEYRSSPEEVYNRVVKYDDEQATVKIHVIDIETMKDEIKLDCDSGIMLLYSIIEHSSYNEAKYVLQHLTETGISRKYPVVFIGNKRDLSRLRTVDRKDAFSFSNTYNCTHFEVAAATDKRVKDCFHALFRQIEVRQMLSNSDDSDNQPSILNPQKISRNGVVRYGTA